MGPEEKDSDDPFRRYCQEDPYRMGTRYSVETVLESGYSPGQQICVLVLSSADGGTFEDYRYWPSMVLRSRS